MLLVKILYIEERERRKMKLFLFFFVFIFYILFFLFFTFFLNKIFVWGLRKHILAVLALRERILEKYMYFS